MSVLIGSGGRPFTAEQSDAIRLREGSLLLEANAGSGKTSVLVERFVRSVLEDGIRPPRILAITFTERAAGELRARVRERFVELGRRDEARETETAWVSTIHGFCARLLRAHAISAGLDPAFVVIEESDARTLRDRAWERALAEMLDGEHAAAALDLVAAYDTDRLRRMIASVHDALRSAGRTRPSLPTAPAAGDPDALRDALATAAAAAAGELHLAGAGKRVCEARAKVARCIELLAADARGAADRPGRAPRRASRAPVGRGAGRDALRRVGQRAAHAGLRALPRRARGFRRRPSRPRRGRRRGAARRAARALRRCLRRRQARARRPGLRRPRAGRARPARGRAGAAALLRRALRPRHGRRVPGLQRPPDRALRGARPRRPVRRRGRAAVDLRLPAR